MVLFFHFGGFVVAFFEFGFAGSTFAASEVFPDHGFEGADFGEGFSGVFDFEVDSHVSDRGSAA